ncbi:MAG: hypothetical protein Q7W45_01630 [Bacteroidota bacterium]|nr:hypothetical protein [Bacteroidota bacterium]MDP3144543.1 hypothetical protein [Bacteroidota bacterium]MDP3555786.1 hypothetical protein [Bacteroidota bacterium]
MESLEQIDSLYNTTISKLPKKERVEYCENLIDNAQLNLVRNKKHINKELENQLYNLILSAQAELNKLRNQ